MAPPAGVARAGGRRLIRRVDRSRLGLLWPFVRPHGRAFVGAAALLALSFGVELLGPWLVRTAVDGPIRSALDGAEGAGRALLTLGALYFAAVVVGREVSDRSMLIAHCGRRSSDLNQSQLK